MAIPFRSLTRRLEHRKRKSTRPFHPVKINTQHIRSLKGKQPVTALAVYDATSAALASEAGVDLLLVGDSMGNVILGFPNTLPVTLDMILHHTAAVARAKPASLVVSDIPFTEAHRDADILLAAAARCLQEAGAEAVKIEGGVTMADKIRRLTAAGVPVLAHIGLLPQQIYQMGGYRRFGKTPEERESLLADARAVTAAGAFAVVAEMVDHETAGVIARDIPVPLIGIGSGPHCDGQILVGQDVLGLTPGKTPAFVKAYARLGEEVKTAFSNYVREVRERKFPT